MVENATAQKELETPELDDAPAAQGITVARFGLLEHHNSIWRVNAPMGVTPKQTLNEQYWEHVSMHLRPGDEIRVMPDNMAWEQVLHVVNAGKLYAHVIEKELYLLTPSTEGIKLPSVYKVEFTGSHHKWRVIREGRMLKDGFASEALATRYAANHEAAVNRG